MSSPFEKLDFIKEKLKPTWYALMTYMQDEYPNEIKKMGSELEESVNEIIKNIEDLKKDKNATKN